jgi:DNA-binding XRE family transcriptional regulator
MTMPAHTTSRSPWLDRNAIDDMFRPEGRWARERGAALKERRIECGLTPGQLADASGVRHPTVYRIETGAIIPSFSLRVILAFNLDTRPEVLWPYPSDETVKGLRSK